MAGGNALGHRKYNAPVKSACGSAGLSMGVLNLKSILGYDAPHPRHRRGHGISPDSQGMFKSALRGLRGDESQAGELLR